MSRSQKFKKLKQELAAAKSQNTGGDSKGKGAGKGDGKGKGAGKDGKRTFSMPAAMMAGGCTPFRTGAGGATEPLCFGFNLGTCDSGVAPGEKCRRGLHLCAKLVNGAACAGKHAFSACTR